MTCHIGRFIPRWLLSTFNFIILMLTFLTLLVSVLMVTVPGHTLDFLLYILEQPGLEVPPATQEAIFINLSPDLMAGLGASLLTVSLLIAVPATTGYVGAVRESRLCLILYLCPLILLWSCQLAFLILLPVIKTQLYAITSSLARISLHLYTESKEGNVVSFLWNIVMIHLECCGVSGHQDFQDSELWSRERQTKQILPAVCCVQDTLRYPISRISPLDSHCTSVPTTYNSHWQQGCLPRVSSLASEYTSMIILVIISVLTVEIVVIILACCLCFLQKYRRDKNCQRIIVTKETSQQHSQQERNNWNNSSLRDERRNLIYTEAMNDGVP